MASTDTSALRPFRSRRGRWVAIGSAVVLTVLFAAIALSMTMWSGPERVLTGLTGLGLGAFLWRYAAIRAVPDRQGITVRNLFTTQRVEWSQVQAVRFAEGDPWARLVRTGHLEDVAVMAVQAADGQSARAEASRLAGIVQALGANRAQPSSEA